MPSKRQNKSSKNVVEAPSAAAPLSPPAAPSSSLPLLGFADPRAALSEEVRTVVENALAKASADEKKQHLVPHMRKGLEQIERFMEKAHTDASGVVFKDFETMALRSSEQWHNHVKYAQDNKKEMNVQPRKLQDSLRLQMSGYDLKVGRPGRPDDSVYQASEYARKYMPRGNFVAEWTSPVTGKVVHFPMVRAYRKFTGQEDDAEENGKVGDEMLSKFFTKPASQATHVISTTKENGEAAHLAVLKRSDGEYLFVVGSKNTHMVVASIEDIDRACKAGAKEGGNPYMAAEPIARAMLKTINRMTPENRVFLCELLAQTRMTASFEMLSPGYQHVQLLDYLEEDTPVFYGLSFPSLDEVEGVEICVNPVLAYELMQSLGLRTVEFKVVANTPDLMAQTLYEIRTSYQHEGAVNLFLDENASVIGMEKFKTVWYVCLRAIREKAKSFLNKAMPKAKPADKAAPAKKGGNGKKKQAAEVETAAKTAEEVAFDALQDTRKSLQKRFKAIQSYLDLTDEECAAYQSLGESFVMYLHDERLKGCGTNADAKKQLKEHVATMFPVAWKEFLEHTQLSDKVIA